MSNLPITITVKLLAPYQEAEGLSELKLQFTQETPVSQVLERLSATPPPVLGAIAHLAPLSKSLLSENGATSQIDRTRLGINQEFATRDTPLQNCDEVVLIPPVSSPLLPSDSPPMAISLSPGGRSS